MEACQGELIIAGYGLSESMVAMETLHAVSTADRVYVEVYTTPGAERMLLFARRARPLGDVTPVTRKEVEEHSDTLLEPVRRGERVVFLVYGDPFVATTHNALRVEAAKAGCRTRYVPGVSIYQYAASLTGLSHYKFGQSVTVVYPRWGILHTSPYMVISENLRRGLHTFVFLDVDEELGPMLPSIAADLLLKAGEELGASVPGEESVVIVLERLGSEEEGVHCLRLGELRKRPWTNPPYSLIIPASLHFMESEVLGHVGKGCRELLGGASGGAKETGRAVHLDS